MSRGPSPRVPSSQASRAPLENTTCSTGRSLAAERAVNRVARLRNCERGRVQDHRRRAGRQGVRHQGRRDRLLQALGVDRHGAEAARRQGLDHGVHRRHLPGLHQRPVEHQRHRRGVRRRPAGADRVQVRAVESRPVQPGARDRRRLPPLGGPAEQVVGIGEELAGVVRAALLQVAPDPVHRLGRQGRAAHQVGIRCVVAGHAGQRHAVLAGGTGDLLDAVRPVGDAADQPDDHQPGVRDDLLGVDVDRQVVLQPHDVGEPQAGGVRRLPGARRGQGREVAVGGRQHHHFAGRLAEVDGLRPVVDRARAGGEKVHQEILVARFMAAGGFRLEPLRWRGSSRPE